MAVNKVIFGGETVIDLTGDDVTPEKLVMGTKAHDKSGEPVVGTNPYEKAATDAAVEDIAAAIAGKGVTVPDGTMLDGMAALIESIEAGGGGESQCVTGTFTPTSEDLMNNPITVTGIGFKPKILYIRYDDDNVYVNSTTQLTTTGKFYLIDGIKSAEYYKLVFYYYNSSSTARAIRTDRESYLTIEIIDDGFTINTTDDRYYIAKRPYLYIVYG